MQHYANKYVRASEIATYYLCPRLVYLGRQRAATITDMEVRAGVFKSISLGLGPVPASPRPEAAIEEVIRLACSDAFLVYGPAHEPAIAEAGREARSRAGDMLAGLLKEKESVGEQGLDRLLSPAFVSLTIYSDELRMSGTLDKVILGGRGPEPVIISASLPPPSGAYASDHVRLAAYAMLLAEKYDTECRRGAIEYVRGWCVRHTEVRPEDKRKALYARNRVLEFMGGRMPDAVRGKWCGRCGHSATCSVKATLLDSLFKKRT